VLCAESIFQVHEVQQGRPFLAIIRCRRARDSVRLPRRGTGGEGEGFRLLGGAPYASKRAVFRMDAKGQIVSVPRGKTGGSELLHGGVVQPDG